MSRYRGLEHHPGFVGYCPIGVLRPGMAPPLRVIHSCQIDPILVEEVSVSVMVGFDLEPVVDSVGGVSETNATEPATSFVFLSGHRKRVIGSQTLNQIIEAESKDSLFLDESTEARVRNEQTRTNFRVGSIAVMGNKTRGEHANAAKVGLPVPKPRKTTESL